MAFCSQCGKPMEAGAVCAACGSPSAPAIEAMTAELRRQRKEMRYLVAALVLVLASTLGLIAGWMVRGERKGISGTSDSAVKGQQSAPAQAVDQNSPASPVASAPESVQPKQQSAPAVASKESSSASGSLPATIDPQAVQNALNATQRGGQTGTWSQTTTANSSASSAADHYPGSQALDVNDAALPDIGIPVASQVYSTSDSLSTVMAYYKQLYPDAQVMEINGQNIIAVDRPGMTKVIAIGTTGSETRIAIVQPGN